MRTLNSTIMAQLAAKTLRPFLILDMDIDGTHYRYTDADVPIGVRYKVEAITGGPTVHGLSLADGVAFARLNGLDLSPFAGLAGVRTPCKLILTDSAGKQAVGWIAEADAAEALGDEIVTTNADFETVAAGPDWTGWVEVAGDGALADEGAIVHGGSHSAKITTGPSNNTSLQGSIGVTVGMLYKFTIWVYGDGTHSGLVCVYGASGYSMPWTSVGHTAASWAQKTFYFTALDANPAIYLVSANANGAITYFDDVSVKEVTHAGTDGVHIVSAQNGSTRNWTSIEAGFDYNDDTYTAEISNVRFSPRGMKIDPVRYSLSKVVDSMRLQIDNLDDVLTAPFVDGTPQGGDVTLSVVLLDSNYELVAAPQTLFAGTIDGWDLDEEKVTMTVASELVRWNQRTLAKHGASCRWKEFNGTECQYAGAETWCDRTYTRCAALGNTANYGGFRWLPSIIDKEIWWGYTPNPPAHWEGML